MKKKIIGIITFLLITLLFCVGAAADSKYSGYIVRLKKAADSVSLFTENNIDSKIQSDDNIYVISSGERLYSVESIDDILKYVDYSKIEHIEPDYTMELFYEPDDTFYKPTSEQDYQWALRTINAPYFWNSGCYGQGVKVAVIDNGVASHPDLDSNVLEGYNTIKNTTDVTPDKYDAVKYSGSSHGTFVSGIIAAAANNGRGIAGLAYGAKIVPFKSLGMSESDRKTSFMSSAIYRAVNCGCRVINISAGTPYRSEELEKAINYALSKNVIVVAASGNDSNNTVNYPASFDGVISVASIGADRKIAATSTYNEHVFIAAPGEKVFSTYTDTESKYVKWSGTSFAAPHVSAAAAMCLNINPDMTVQQFRELLMRSTDDDAEYEGRDDHYGYGILNMQKLLDNMLDGKDYNLSPVYYDPSDSDSFSIVYNNTDSPIEMYSFMKNQSGEKVFEPFSAGAKNSENPSSSRLYTKYADGDVTQNIWAKNLRPILKKENAYISEYLPRPADVSDSPIYDSGDSLENQ